MLQLRKHAKVIIINHNRRLIKMCENLSFLSTRIYAKILTYYKNNPNHLLNC